MAKLTFTAAKTACRELGFTLRKTTPGESEMVLYLVGTGQDSPSAYFTDDPADALGTARAWADDIANSRLALGRQTTAKGKEAAATIAAQEAAAVDYPTPVKPLTGKAAHAVWGGATPPEQIRAASFAFHRQRGQVAWVALENMRADVRAAKVRFPKFHADANADFAGYGESRVRWTENPAALGLRLVGLAHDAAPANYSYLRAAVDHTGWWLDPDGGGETVAGVVYQTSGHGGRARYLVGYADPYNTDSDGNGPALLSLAPITGERLDSHWDHDPALRDAARRADGMAEAMADRERAYQESHRAGRDAREAGVAMRETGSRWADSVRALKAAFARRRDLGGDGRAVVSALVSCVRDHCESLEESRDKFRDALDAGCGCDAWRDGYGAGV